MLFSLWKNQKSVIQLLAELTFFRGNYAAGGWVHYFLLGGELQYSEKNMDLEIAD